jgi:hypothetical protein
MKLSQLSEVIFNFYHEGRASATTRSFSQQDVEQYAKMSYGNLMRQLYYANRNSNNGDEYYFYTSILSVKRFKLSDAKPNGMRRADMGDIDLYKLPKNAHFANVYFVGGDNEQGENITQVAPAEENFYLSPDFKFFKFYVVKGRGINTYHLPPCITHVDIETTYDDPDIDVPLDVCYDVATAVLGGMLRMPAFVNKDVDNPYSIEQVNLKQKLGVQPQPAIPQ